MEKAIGGLILYLASVDWGKVLVAVAKGLTLALRVQMEILFGVAKELGGQIVHGIGSGLDALAGVVASAFKGLGHMIASAFNAALDAVVKVAIEAAPTVIEPYSHIPSKGGQWARDLKDKFNAALEGMDAKKPLANAGTVGKSRTVTVGVCASRLEAIRQAQTFIDAIMDWAA